MQIGLQALYILFLRDPKPLVICDGILVSSIWQLFSIDYGINLSDRDCANWYTGIKFGAHVY